MGSKVSQVRHTLIFSRVIEVLMPERLEESRGATKPGVGLLGGTVILCFKLCMNATHNCMAWWVSLDIQHITVFIAEYLYDQHGVNEGSYLPFNYV